MIFTRGHADALLAAAPGPAYLAVPAEPVPCPADTDGDGNCATCFRQPGIHGDGPPAEWVALTEPCDRWVTVAGHQDGCEGVYCEQMCPVQVQAECPDCEGSGRRRFPIVVECTSDRFKPGFRMCSDCGMTGKITLGSAEVIELLPIVTGGDRNGEHRIIMHGHDPWLTAVVHGPPSLTEPIGAPEPGGYIIHIDNIKATT